MNTFGTWVRQQRRRQGWSQATLAAALPEPVSRVAISFIETGQTRMTLDLLFDLARTLDADPREIVERIVGR